MLRPTGITYYCNLSSPYVKDSEGVKYIDYDLDVKVFPSGDKIILDRDEFEFNQVDYEYPEKLVQIVEKEMKECRKELLECLKALDDIPEEEKPEGTTDEDKKSLDVVGYELVELPDLK